MHSAVVCQRIERRFDALAAVAGHDVIAEPDEVRLRIGVALQDAGLAAARGMGLG